MPFYDVPLILHNNSIIVIFYVSLIIYCIIIPFSQTFIRNHTPLLDVICYSYLYPAFCNQKLRPKMLLMKVS